jgi:uncharacterized protein (TIGR02996 family)
MTSDPQEQAFLADIREHPEDDAPRLIFADWLEERGKPGDAARAEFIRVQCKLAVAHITRSPRTNLERREWELLAGHREEWMHPLRAVMPLHDDDVTFARGFPAASPSTRSRTWSTPRGLRPSHPSRKCIST